MNNSSLNPNSKKNPSNWEDVNGLKNFISEISISLNRNQDDIDKFLMMFGKELKKK
jgi:Leucine-rich repeat (LRR) protein